jgi:uncharacterized protein YjbJ (UPF0337 family)
MPPPLHQHHNNNTRIMAFISAEKTPLKGNWKQQRSKLKQKFAVLTDKDLLFEQGKQDEMLENLQGKLGMTKEELVKIIESL